MYSQEIAQSKVLQWSLGALMFVYFIVFSSWIASYSGTKEAIQNLDYVCPPYFQSCEVFYFLDALPYGYSQSLLYMAFFAIFAWCGYLFAQRAWLLIQVSLIPAFIWHALNILIITDNRGGNYEYYLMAFGLVLLFFPHKEFFLKLTLVFFYVLSTISKIHPSWIEGGYFTGLRTGLPFFPDWSIPLATNLVILMEMVGSWFLLSRNMILQRISFTFFTIFHLYSGILVMYRYPANVLPFLLILFGPWYRHTHVPLNRKSIVGWAFILLLLVLQFSPKFIPGDEKLTLEANKYGLYMFEANHQCISQGEYIMNDGTRHPFTTVSEIARSRCQPYSNWFRLKNKCEQDATIDRIEWRFDHSINGGPFYRIVDEQDACKLTFNAFEHNSWIQTSDTAKIIGYPVRNVYY